MRKEYYSLSEEERDKFIKFVEEHKDCNLDEIITLSNIYNIKLVFNISKDNIVKTCLCSVCGSEELISDPEELINEKRD